MPINVRMVYPFNYCDMTRKLEVYDGVLGKVMSEWTHLVEVYSEIAEVEVCLLRLCHFEGHRRH